jgi:hypothetical protein
MPLAFVLLGAFCAAAQDNDTDFQTTISGENCTFLADRDAFLKHDLRAHQAIQARVLTLDKNRMAAATASTVPIARRNFIDDEIFNRLEAERIAPAPLSSDEEFFRRIHLDLTGRIPSAADVREFDANKDPNKRSALIDRLLFSDAYADKWTMWFGDLLENNAGSTNFNNRGINARNAFYRYIWASVLEQNSMQSVVYGILTARGNTFEDFNPSNYILNGNAPGGPINDTYDMLMYKSARQFLGLGHYDCLLCHSGRGRLDSLSVWGKYETRTDAQRMAAFFARTQFRGNNPNDGSQNVTDNTTGTYALPTTFGNRPNRPMIDNQRFATPRYRNGSVPSSGDWRAEYASFVVNDPMFAISFVNRVWKEMFNLGLVDAADSLDPDRLDPSKPLEAGWEYQATHPALLQRLAQDFVAKNYNLRELIRTIAESSAYQLSSRYPGEWNMRYVPMFARHYPRRLSGEEMHDAVAKATGVFARYTVQGWSDPVTWAMQLPDTSEPRSNGQANNFMNLFLRGNRDNITRSQGSTIQQASGLMNDAFIRDRIHVNQSPTLRDVAALPTNEAKLETMYLTFLGRLPSEFERTRGLAHLATATTAAQRNTVLEDLAWALINKLEFQFSY